MKRIILLAASVLMLAACAPKGSTSVSDPVDPASYRSSDPAVMTQVCDFLKSCGYYFIATEDGDQPRVRPFGTSEIFDGKLYIQTGHVKKVARQIAENPKIEICAYNGQQWMRIAATLVEDHRVEAKKAMLDANPSLRSMYDENDGNTALYFLTDASVTIDSFTSTQQSLAF